MSDFSLDDKEITDRFSHLMEFHPQSVRDCSCFCHCNVEPQNLSFTLLSFYPGGNERSTSNVSGYLIHSVIIILLLISPAIFPV